MQENFVSADRKRSPITDILLSPFIQGVTKLETKSNLLTDATEYTEDIQVYTEMHMLINYRLHSIQQIYTDKIKFTVQLGICKQNVYEHKLSIGYD